MAVQRAHCCTVYGPSLNCPFFEWQEIFTTLPHVFVAMSTQQKNSEHSWISDHWRFHPLCISIENVVKCAESEKKPHHSSSAFILWDYCAKSQITKRNGFMCFGIFAAISIMSHAREENRTQPVWGRLREREGEKVRRKEKALAFAIELARARSGVEVWVRSSDWERKGKKSTQEKRREEKRKGKEEEREKKVNLAMEKWQIYVCIVAEKKAAPNWVWWPTIWYWRQT